MRFDKIIPSVSLQPYIKYLAIAGISEPKEYNVLPTTGLVMGFQFEGHLETWEDNLKTKLNTAGITGMTDQAKVFKSSANTGSVLIYFTEVGFSYFTSQPINELFNRSVSLENIFDKNYIHEIEERLSLANSDVKRIKIVEDFLLSQLKTIKSDKLIIEAVKLIHQRHGSIRIGELIASLNISQSPFEKRFRRLVGTTPKKFASVVRFNSILNNLKTNKTLSEICYENNYFDQAHFIHDFKRFTGVTPENFKHSF